MTATTTPARFSPSTRAAAIERKAIASTPMRPAAKSRTIEMRRPAATGMVPRAQTHFAPPKPPMPHMKRPSPRAATATTINTRRKMRSILIERTKLDLMLLQDRFCFPGLRDPYGRRVGLVWRVGQWPADGYKYGHSAFAEGRRGRPGCGCDLLPGIFERMISRYVPNLARNQWLSNARQHLVIRPEEFTGVGNEFAVGGMVNDLDSDNLVAQVRRMARDVLG